MLEDARGAVALVHVAVHHQHLVDDPAVEQVAGRHRHVVESAKARPAVRPGMVAAACGVAGEPDLQRQPRRQHGAAGRGAGALGHRTRDRQADAALHLAGQGQVEHLLYVGRVVDGGEVGEARWLGLRKAGFGNQARLDQHLSQPGVLAHREAVVGGHFGGVGGVVHDRGQGGARGGTSQGTGLKVESSSQSSVRQWGSS